MIFYLTEWYLFNGMILYLPDKILSTSNNYVKYYNISDFKVIYLLKI